MSDQDSTIPDLTTDPLTWPAWDGAPATPDEWLLELRVVVELMRREPTTWQAERWHLQDLDELPSVEFAQRFVAMGAYLSFPDEKRGIPNQLILRRMDELVIEERSRQIRERLRHPITHEGGPPSGVGLTIDHVRQVLRTWEHAWPPTQDGLTGYTGRRVRQVLAGADTSWDEKVAAVESERP